MIQDATAYTIQDEQFSVQLDGVPDQCPICHRNVHPKLRRVERLAERSLVQASWRCTHQKCEELFIATYEDTNRSASRTNIPVFTLCRVAPKHAYKMSFSETIVETSPAFVEIYNQALAAEAAELDQVVGIGLRKALEFLVKDFAIREHPDEVDKIREAFLGKCITNYVKDPNVKACARRAAWLGNDETHYTRRWEDRDIKDLKLLIRLTVNWVENVILTEKYISEMQ